MSHVVSDDLVRSDFVHDQIVANRKSSEFGIARDHAQMRLLGDLGCACSMRATSWAAALRLSSNVFKNFAKIGQRTAFETELHALR